MLFRIFTENRNLEGVHKICSNLFNGYSMFFVIGNYKGQEEPGICIEIDSVGQEGYLDTRVNQAADEIKVLNNQECVLVQKINCTSQMV